jgi:hypothetical protein
MTKKVLKGAMLAAACGTMMQWFGCLNWNRIIQDGLYYVGYEFVLDNDAVFDLFQDDFGTGALYDDRNSAAPTRAEP